MIIKILSSFFPAFHAYVEEEEECSATQSLYCRHCHPIRCSVTPLASLYVRVACFAKKRPNQAGFYANKTANGYSRCIDWMMDKTK